MVALSRMSGRVIAAKRVAKRAASGQHHTQRLDKPATSDSFLPSHFAYSHKYLADFRVIGKCTFRYVLK